MQKIATELERQNISLCMFLMYNINMFHDYSLQL